MSSVILSGDTSGTVTLTAPLVAGSNTVTLPAATGTVELLTRATAVSSTSGTSIDFTGIPSWAKRITVMLSSVSTSGTSIIQVQLGDSGGIENTGYAGSAVTGAGTAAQASSGMIVAQTNVAAGGIDTAMTIVNVTGNTWIFNGNTFIASSIHDYAGSKSLSDTLTQVRITTVNGTDTFDAGTINIMYEG